MSGSTLVCAGCGWQVPVGEPLPFRCVHSGSDDTDHVLVHRLGAAVRLDRGDDPHPFVRYREGLWAWQAARSRGVDDAAFVDQVHRLDAAIAAVDGVGFRATPYRQAQALGDRLGVELWVKDETRNVAGSHKARHLMGVLLHLQGLPDHGAAAAAPLAIASCGNAALAAAVLARAAGRRLQVYVPADAQPTVMARLHRLGAEVMVCHRQPGERGDPCVRQFVQALVAGALPFCCQGNQNGLTIDGGQTLVQEMLGSGAPALDHLVIQVGGGALASACMQAYARAVAAGQLVRAPRVHTVQSQGAWPLRRAWTLVQSALPVPATERSTEQALQHAATHRSAYMWPWETAPHSVASGILDDETYDWLAVLRGMAATGGSAVVADEATLLQAHALARELSDIDVSPTGSAGLAGLMQLQREELIPAGARVGVLFTGRQYAAESQARPA